MSAWNTPRQMLRTVGRGQRGVQGEGSWGAPLHGPPQGKPEKRGLKLLVWYAVLGKQVPKAITGYFYSPGPIFALRDPCSTPRALYSTSRDPISTPRDLFLLPVPRILLSVTLVLLPGP